MSRISLPEDYFWFRESRKVHIDSFLGSCPINPRLSGDPFVAWSSQLIRCHHDGRPPSHCRFLDRVLVGETLLLFRLVQSQTDREIDNLPPPSSTASWCILETNSGTTPDLLECSFDNPVKTIQLDYYSHDLPEVAVSCDETCDVSAVLSTMFRVSSLQPRVLTVDILQVSPRNAGRYRCQAMQDATQLAVEGKCTWFLL
ncbi:hypothetical protein C0Q70_15035 [Pomacea canaliculata]|uniref:Uncharacterized protein n=1 Tax=Pomacea canaliculata TaxID=400727 RepID=A0A2T7NTR1_POMCA|nr:hypothetical protein C0Q70_15035 [Pomacea canaliculata]